MIDVSGSCRIKAQPIDVWKQVFTTDTLIHIIPGCQHLKKISEHEYQGQIEIDLAIVKGTYDTYLRVAKHEDTFQCDLVGEVSGPTGTINGDGFFKLEKMQQATSINYEAKALVTGALAIIHPMLLKSVISILIHRGMDRLNQQLESHDAECNPDEQSTLRNFNIGE